MCSGYPLVSSKLAKMLGFKGYLPLPLSPTPRSKRELRQPLLSHERAKLRGRGKTEKWDSPLIYWNKGLTMNMNHTDLHVNVLCVISVSMRYYYSCY